MTLKLANIITDSTDWFGKEFMVVKTKENCVPNIPTLHVGYTKFKKNNPDVSILKFKYNEATYWTFDKKEDRNGYVSGLSKFKCDIVKLFLNTVKYIFIDPFELTISDIKKIINEVNNKKIYTYFYNENMIYISVDNIILGIDLELISFIGLNRTKLVDKIKSLKNNVLINYQVIIDYKDYLEIMDNQVKLIPYLYSLNEGKKKTISNIRA